VFVRVLLVEDNLIIGDALRDHLVANGWRVDWSLNLHAAMMATDLQTYTLVLLDLHLPDGNGFDLLRHLRKRPQIPAVIILSAYDQLSDRVEGMKLGAVDYLVKPFDLSEMMTRIRELAKPEIYTPADCSARKNLQMTNRRFPVNVALMRDRGVRRKTD
jgi:two-component system, OmpR family, response regulator